MANESNYIQFMPECNQKSVSHQKKEKWLQLKVVRIWISYKTKEVHKFCTKKSASAYVYSPPLKVELRGSKHWYGWNIYIVQKSQITRRK